MRFDRFIKNWKSLLAENFFLKAVTLLFGVGLVLNATVFKKNQILIISPPEVREEYWVSKNNASEDYIEQMGVFFATLSGNLAPQNAAYNINALLKYVVPDIYADIKNSLMGDAMQVIENNMTVSFFPSDVKVDGSTVTVNGESVRRIGSAKPITERVMYKMGFIVRNYRIFLNELYIDYPDKKARVFNSRKEGLTDKELIKKEFEQIEKDMKKESENEQR
jgi:conjugal transfer pilus assembly protein TraE